MQISLDEVKDQIFQLLQSQQLNLGNNKKELSEYMINKLSRINFLNELKVQIGEEFFEKRLKEEKDFNEIFKSRLRIIAKSKFQGLLDGLIVILEGFLKQII